MTMWNCDQAVIVLNSYCVPPKSLKSKGNNSYSFTKGPFMANPLS